MRGVLNAAAQRAVLARVPGDLGGLAADAAEGVRLDLVGGPPAEAFAAARAVFRAAAASPRFAGGVAARFRDLGGSAPLACAAAAYRAGGGMAAHVDAGGCKPLCVLNLGLACDFGAAAATARLAPGDGAALDAAATLHSVAVPADAGAGARVSLMFYAAPAPRARDDDFGDVPDGAAALFDGDGDGDGGDDDGDGGDPSDGDGRADASVESKGAEASADPSDASADPSDADASDDGRVDPSADASDASDASDDGDYRVLLFYAYCRWRDRRAFRDAQAALCERLGLAGRLRVAVDGLNGTLGGSERALEAYVAATTAAGRSAVDGGSLDGVDWKWGEARGDAPVAGQRLRGLRVALAKEVVSLTSCGAVDLARDAARHVSPGEFHELLRAGAARERAVVLFDARNVYERRVGLFRAPGVADASLPLRQFGDLPRALREDRKALPTGATVLMYCTGGVRCEQASRALAAAYGRDDLDVVQLAGGIHRYHERFGATGFFAGKNFVFDGRMAVAPGEPEVVGACATCGAAHDDYATARARCGTCRMRVLQCAACAGAAVACELCAA